MRRDERESILREDVTRAQTSRERAQLENLRVDVRSSPLRGEPLPLRLRNFRPAADSYLVSLGGPLPYMTRLREIEALTAEHVRGLVATWERLAAELPETELADSWCAEVAGWSFDEVNDLIARHNRWYPAESRLPMDPRSGDFVLVNGRDYRLEPLDDEWALALCPAGAGGDVSGSRRSETPFAA